MGLTETTAGMKDLSGSVADATVKLTVLGALFQQVSRALPINDLRAMAVSFGNLNRNLTASYRETRILEEQMKKLSVATNYYARDSLVQMATKLRDSIGSLSAFNREQSKLVEIFTQTYKRDAPRYLDKLAEMSEQMPLLALRIKNASTSVNTLNEVFTKFGKEGLSAYLTAIGKMPSETKGSLDTIDDIFTKFKNSVVRQTLEIGDSVTKNIGGVLKSLKATPEGIGQLAVGAGIVGGGLGVLSKLRPRGTPGIIESAQQAFTFGETTGPITAAIARQGGRRRLLTSLMGGRGVGARLGGIGLGALGIAASGERETGFEQALGYGGSAYAGAQAGFGIGGLIGGVGAPVGAAAGAIIGVTIMALSDKAQSDFKRAIGIVRGGESEREQELRKRGVFVDITEEEEKIRLRAASRFEKGLTAAQLRGEKPIVRRKIEDESLFGIPEMIERGFPSEEAAKRRFKIESIREESTRLFGIEEAFKGVEKGAFKTTEFDKLFSDLTKRMRGKEGTPEEQLEANKLLIQKLEVLSKSIEMYSKPEVQAQIIKEGSTPTEREELADRFKGLLGRLTAERETTRQTAGLGAERAVAIAGIETQKLSQELEDSAARSVKHASEQNGLIQDIIMSRMTELDVIEQQKAIIAEGAKGAKLKAEDEKLLADLENRRLSILRERDMTALKGLELKQQDLELTVATTEAELVRAEAAGKPVEKLREMLDTLAKLKQSLADNLKDQGDMAKNVNLENLSRQKNQEAIAKQANIIETLRQKEGSRVAQLTSEANLRKEMLSITTEGLGPINQYLSIEEDILLLRKRLATPAEKGGLQDQERTDAENQLKLLEERSALQKGVIIPMAEKQLELEIAQQKAQILGGAGIEDETGFLKTQIEIINIRLNGEEKLDKLQKDRLLRQKDSLNLQIRLNEEANTLTRQAQRQNELASKQLSLLQTIKAPVGAMSEAYKNVVASQQEMLVLARQRLDKLTNEKAGAEAIHKARLEVKDAEIAIAQTLDVQRRSFAEIFTEQMLNMPTGSYLNPSMVSGFGLQGQSYMTGVSQNPFAGGRGTYQSQIAGIYGEGVSEKSNWEETIAGLLGGILKVEVTNPQDIPNPIGEGAAGGR